MPELVLIQDGQQNDNRRTGRRSDFKEMEMTNFSQKMIAAMAVSVLVFGLSGCEKKEGPMERAGKEVDKTVEKAGQQIEKAGEKIQDTVQDAKK